ncbi:MAG TPA: hypothetical protein V6D26_11790 [Stenomitos sp.]
MRIHTKTVFTGLMLPLLISAVSAYPASAINLEGSKSPTFLLSQATQAGELAGSINSINGQTVEFAQSNGQTRNITISRRVINRLGLRAGSRIAVRLNSRGVATSVRVIRPIRALG